MSASGSVANLRILQGLEDNRLSLADRLRTLRVTMKRTVTIFLGLACLTIGCTFVAIMNPGGAASLAIAEDRKMSEPAPAARIDFRDVAQESGVLFQFDTGSRGKHDMPEIMGGGVAIFDADGDGRLDIYLCNGGPIELPPGRPEPPCRLFRNLGDWHRIEVECPWGTRELWTQPIRVNHDPLFIQQGKGTSEHQ
jgi:hypothetical protein